jgi:hypothetical protein
MSDSTCLNCGSSDLERPLLTLQFQGKKFHIWPQCMPILIHKPENLADKLPNFRAPESPPPDDH